MLVARTLHPCCTGRKERELCAAVALCTCSCTGCEVSATAVSSHVRVSVFLCQWHCGVRHSCGERHGASQPLGVSLRSDVPDTVAEPLRGAAQVETRDYSFVTPIVVVWQGLSHAPLAWCQPQEARFGAGPRLGPCLRYLPPADSSRSRHRFACQLAAAPSSVTVRTSVKAPSAEAARFSVLCGSSERVVRCLSAGFKD